MQGKSLGETRREIVKRERANGKTLEEIGVSLGLTTERVRQIELQTLRG